MPLFQESWSLRGGEIESSREEAIKDEVRWAGEREGDTEKRTVESTMLCFCLPNSRQG